MSYRVDKRFALSRNGEKSENPVLWPWPLTYDLDIPYGSGGFQGTCNVQHFIKVTFSGSWAGEKKLSNDAENNTALASAGSNYYHTKTLI